MTDLPAIRAAHGFALLIQPWPPVMARRLGQVELSPLPKPRRAAYQLQLALTGRRSLELLGRLEGEKPGS